jgi:hypothetical protein
MTTDARRDLLRHAVATVGYRGRKALSGAPEGFAGFRASPKTRTPAEILAHVGDLLDWSLSLAKGMEQWRNSEPLAWGQEVQRFFAGLVAFDAYLASDLPLGASAEKLFQGPIADALTHIGQIAMLRRLAGAPVKGENYFGAKISVGQVGPEQPPPVREFD